jgi:diaminohydroxyphosphoribosylaminopyrimidine deaminase/5-amino-6-(5-phosphoribosylamino)uracil reductase
MTDEQYMQRALDLAKQGRGRTSPNPMVGCVIVRDGQIVGEGWHRKAGEAHAEVEAIRNAGDKVTGSTMYVTLEPCCHEGRTPPCLDLILKHKPERVVVAMHDPNPKVSGESIFRLRAAGIGVDVGVLEKEAEQLNEAFVKYITTRMPFVIAKCGMTLDGKIATRTGDSKWVTSEASRHLVHELRNEVDAILVGSRTVMTDDPSLTTRLDEGKIKDPVRIILDADDYLDPNARVFHLESSAPTWVAVPEDRDFHGAAQVIRVRKTRRGVDMIDLMHELAKREIMTVLIEGGGTTHATAFNAGVVDKVMFFIAPKIIGGRDAVTAVEGEGAEKMSDAIFLERMTARPIGEDLLIEAYVKKEI